MSSTNRIVLSLLVWACVVSWPGSSLAYRPFDSTDAAVADVSELEIELGPVEFRRSGAERTVIAPAYVFNYGFAEDWELVLEGTAEHQLVPAEDNRSRLVDNGLFLKQRRLSIWRELARYHLAARLLGNDSLRRRRRPHARSPCRPVRGNDRRGAV